MKSILFCITMYDFKKGMSFIMKILLINHFPLSGSGSGPYVHNIAKSLVQRGHEVCVIIPENTTNIEHDPNVKIHPVYFYRDEIIEDQLNFNFPCMDPHPRSNFLFENMTELQLEQYIHAFKKAIKEEIEEFKPDIIHSQHIWIISGILKEFNIPYIITSHGAEFITYSKTNRFDEFGFNAVNNAKSIIAISDDNVKDITTKFSKSNEKLEVLRNGYNSTDFFRKKVNKNEILKKYGIQKGFKKIVLFVGRVSKMKGLDTLFQSAKIYGKEDILTLIVGDGDYKEELDKIKCDLELSNIIFLGNRNQNELNDLYNISDVLVLPSRKEALPMVIIEAMACGTAVVVTNLEGISKIVTEEVGLTFEMDNKEMLANQIEKIINEEKIPTAPVIIDDDVWIGARCLILKGVHIGARSIIAAGSVVTNDIPADVIAGGNPCRVIRQIET